MKAIELRKAVKEMQNRSKEKHALCLRVKPDHAPARQFWAGQVCAFEMVLDLCSRRDERKEG